MKQAQQEQEEQPATYHILLTTYDLPPTAATATSQPLQKTPTIKLLQKRSGTITGELLQKNTRGKKTQAAPPRNTLAAIPKKQS